MIPSRNVAYIDSYYVTKDQALSSIFSPSRDILLKNGNSVLRLALKPVLDIILALDFFSSKGRFSETWMITWGIQMKLWGMTLSSVRQICKVLAIFLPRFPNFRYFLTFWKFQYAISRWQLRQHCCSFSTDNIGARSLLCEKIRGFPCKMHILQAIL